MISLMKETPEARSWIYNVLLESGIRLTTVEGFSIRNNKVTALFERLKSAIDVEVYLETEIRSWLEQNEREESIARFILASTLQAPLYLVLWQEKNDKFRIFSLSIESNEIKLTNKIIFTSCKDFANWLGQLKGIPVTKGFIEAGRLSSIDRCLRLHNVPWPGNLDGFLVSDSTGNVNAIFELRRTRKYSVRNHNLNNYFNIDVHGWSALDIMRTQLNVPLYILTWSSTETIVKIQKLHSITRNLLFEKTEFVERNQLSSWFGEITHV